MDNKTGVGENSTIYRNDSILMLIYSLSGMTSFSRDISELSTLKNTRSDETQMFHNIPLVNVEEKSDKVESAFRDLAKKFTWLPHYTNLPFVIGFAISIKRLQVYLMTADEGWKENLPIVNVDIENIGQRAQCLLYAVNIARVMKFFTESGYLQPSSVEYNRWVVRPSKEIRLFSSHVENKYAEETKYVAMKALYLRLSELGISHIELPIADRPFDDTLRTIRLKPVGVQRKPRSIKELRTALRHVMRCMRALHKAEYLHCDLRWPNIILVGRKWYVIDCTESIAVNDLQKDRLAVSRRINEENNFDSSLPWSMRHDYYQFGMLIRNCRLDTPEECNDIAKKLCDKNIPTISMEDIEIIAEYFERNRKRKRAEGA